MQTQNWNLTSEKWFRILCAVFGTIGLVGLYFYWWTENLLQNLFVMGVCIWLLYHGLKPWLTLPEPEFASRGTRKDFFRCIQSLESENVNVSAGEIDIGHDRWIEACLIQLGPPGHYACAYLNDQQVRNLVAALTAYLTAEPEPAK